MHSTCIHPSCHVSPFIIPSHSLNQPTHASTFLPSDFQHCTCIPLTISSILAVLHMHSLNLAVMFPLPSIHLPIKTIHTSHNIHSFSFTLPYSRNSSKPLHTLAAATKTLFSSLLIQTPSFHLHHSPNHSHHQTSP